MGSPVCGPPPRACLYTSIGPSLYVSTVFAHFSYGVVMVVIHLCMFSPPYNIDAVEGWVGEEPFLQLLDLHYSVRVRVPEGPWAIVVQVATLGLQGGGTLLGVLIGIWAIVSVVCAACSEVGSNMKKAWIWSMIAQLVLFAYIQLVKAPAVCEPVGWDPIMERDILPFEEVSTNCGVVTVLHAEHTWLVGLVAAFLIWTSHDWIQRHDPNAEVAYDGELLRCSQRSQPVVLVPDFAGSAQDSAQERGPYYVSPPPSTGAPSQTRSYPRGPRSNHSGYSRTSQGRSYVGNHAPEAYDHPVQAR
mmetsp:Transcript_97901/g.261246  ORF Transcript_97901/g.261246 Transcript_97901/m.261246 type:complete len:302 (-) Transcript_97901:119-1024(-)